jgi:membrane protein implicated in regulation of membrane protease activity
LGFLLVVMGFIQTYDFGLNLINGELEAETVGMLVLAVLNFVSAWSLLKRYPRSA